MDKGVAMLRKIDLMHKLFGELSGRHCKDCKHLKSHLMNRKYYKCECYGDTPSEATDWRLKWVACGLIDVAVYKGCPVVKMVRSLNWKPKEVKEIDGQMSLFENEVIKE